MPTHRFCLLGRMNSLDRALPSGPSVAPVCQKPWLAVKAHPGPHTMIEMRLDPEVKGTDKALLGLHLEWKRDRTQAGRPWLYKDSSLLLIGKGLVLLGGYWPLRQFIDAFWSRGFYFKSDLTVTGCPGSALREACVIMTVSHVHNGFRSGLVPVIPNCLAQKVLTILVKRNEGSGLVKTTVLCVIEVSFLFDPSRLKIKSFKSKKKKIQKVKINLSSLYSLSSPARRITFFVISSNIFVRHFLSYVLDHILVGLIIFLLCFGYTIFLWLVSDCKACGL